jgi:dTDP-4-dehydrorhamnose reductase
LRTSIIGPELSGAHGLVGWFLAQRGEVKGFTRAIFSGVPTVELARVIRNFVIPIAGLRGIYHVSSAPINKFELLSLVAREFGVETKIRPDPALSIDRSLDSTRFREATGYTAPAWEELIRAMKAFG